MKTVGRYKHIRDARKQLVAEYGLPADASYMTVAREVVKRKNYLVDGGIENMQNALFVIAHESHRLNRI